MGRRGGGMRSGGAKPRPAAPPRRAPAPAPAPRAPAAPPAQSSGGGMLSGIGSTIAQGMAFGTGSAIAHRAVGAVAGSMSGGGSSEAAPAPEHGAYEQQAAPINPCDQDQNQFYACLQQNNNDVTACQFTFEALQNCQLNQKKYSTA
ncbi:unnamed protein product [Chrysoparadoxa australica]